MPLNVTLLILELQTALFPPYGKWLLKEQVLSEQENASSDKHKLLSLLL